MVLLYRLFGFLYLSSGLWCVFKLELVAGFLGFEFSTDMGKSEFFSVYGGLQIGIGIAMLLSSFKTVYLEGGVYFSAIFSSVLALFRVFSFFVFGFIEGFIFMLVLEVFMAVSLWGIWLKLKK
tara:strand:- start:39959 stop:40327 length:369 start_codon:yes stop_codon:yes gene_type:complete